MVPCLVRIAGWNRLNEFLAKVLQLIAALAWPRLRERLSIMAQELLPDLPELAGYWIAHFEDPTPTGRAVMSVEICLQQVGRSLRGQGHILAQPGETFNFQGAIRRNVFFGSFARQDTRVLAGTGAFILKIIADSKHLRGNCLWYDGSLDDVWVSPYHWQRVPAGSFSTGGASFVEVHLGNHQYNHLVLLRDRPLEASLFPES